MKSCDRIFVALALPVIAGFALACGGAPAMRAPRWACPSPEPLPWGAAGPVKETVREVEPTAAPSGPVTYRDTPVYFEEWEQEYGQLGGPPFPSPTPYARVGTHYSLGQRVEVWPFHVLVDARPGPIVSAPGVADGSQQLYFVDITWDNHALEEVPIAYAERVRLRAITNREGAVVSDGRWGVNALALQLARVSDLPDAIAPGVSQVTLPILAPPGQPQTVEIVFDTGSTSIPSLPTATAGPGDPLPTTMPPSPTAPVSTNPELRASEPQQLAVQWSSGSWSGGGAEPCGDPGALTDWSNDGDGAWGREAALAVTAPPGDERLIQLVLNQVGKRYIWDAKGPETFDCSGLASWAYGQIGITIPQGTAGQWPGMRPVERGALLPGDLVFFDVQGRGRVDHVGVLVGDLDGDGRWDMVHAASPALGVRVDYAVFESAYYAPRVRGFRTAR